MRTNHTVAPLRVGLLVTPHFTLNALANFVDVLRLSSDDGDASRGVRCQYHLMSSNRLPIRASCGYQLTPTAHLMEPDKLDYIALIGGLLYRGRSIDSTTQAYLRRAAKTGATLLGICTGSFVLCRLGLMRARRCCVSWFHYRDFVAEFPEIVPVADELYIDERDRITCSGGVGAALTAALLVERHLDSEVAARSLRIMQIVVPAANVQPAPPSTANSESDLVSRALLLMEQHIGEPIPIDQIASRLGVSRRTLERQFERHTGSVPRASYMRLRLRQARILLKLKKSLSQIAAETGFADGSHFNRAFRQQFGYPPSQEPV